MFAILPVQSFVGVIEKFCNYKDGIKYKLSYPEAVTVCPAPIGTIIVDVGIYPSETANLQAWILSIFTIVIFLLLPALATRIHPFAIGIYPEVILIASK